MTTTTDFAKQNTNSINKISRFNAIQLISVETLLLQNQTKHDHKSNDSTHYSLIYAAAELLSRQWKRGGSTDDYYQKITATSSSVDDVGCLPASYLLVGTNMPGINDTKELVLIGHGRLIECYESLAGRAAAVTYVVILEEYRNQQYGNQLMKLLEHQSIQLGYHYIYLWTQTAIPFYIKLGYTITHRVSLYRSCLKPLQSEQVTLLEDMLRSKLQLSLVRRRQEHQSDIQNTTESKSLAGSEMITDINQSNKTRDENSCSHDMSNVTIKRTETIMLPPTNDDNDVATTAKNDDVWLRKRLVEQINIVTIIPFEERIDEIKVGIELYLKRQHINNKNGKNRNVWIYYLVNVPWQQQVGPSCGLAALRMIRDYYYFYCNTMYGNNKAVSGSWNDHYGNDITSHENTATKFASLLSVAKNLGYTDDGEIFDANNLVRLVNGTGTEQSNNNENNCCGDMISCEMKSFQSITPIDVLQCLSQIDMANNTNTNGLYIIPYDTHKITKLPCCNTGLSAHYGIIVGIVFCDNNKIDDPSIDSNATTIDGPNGSEVDAPILLEPLDTISCTTGSRFEGSSIDTLTNYTNDNVLLLVQHGLSSKLSIASWNEFFISNQQLTSYDTTKYNKVTKLDLQDRILQLYRRRVE
jgi:ribosomal protein S18 acetylase RimI-like enzyme